MRVIGRIHQYPPSGGVSSTPQPLGSRPANHPLPFGFGCVLDHAVRGVGRSPNPRPEQLAADHRPRDVPLHDEWAGHPDHPDRSGVDGRPFEDVAIAGVGIAANDTTRA